MQSQVSISLPNTIESIRILDDHTEPVQADSKFGGRLSDLSVEKQEKELTEACRALQAAAAKIQGLYEKIIAQNREEIAKLSVGIARKILMHKIEKKDYEIESIIKEVLKNSPSRQDVVVHLNPEDFERCQKIQEKEKNGILDGVKLVADPDVGCAECILKSPKGNIVSLINEQLEQISEALGKV